MKNLALSITAIFFLAATLTAQSVVVTTKKTVYKRPKPISDYKRSFTISYPKVKAATPALSRKIESTIAFEKNLGLNLKEELSDLQWLEEANYEVKYNARGILVISLWMEGTAAYPDSVTKTLAVDTKAGNRITPAKAFQNAAGLVALIQKKQNAEIEARIKELKEDPEEKDNDPRQLFAEEKFTAKSLEEFSIDGKGITFMYEYGFPHVIQALEPEGRYFFKWSDIGKFIAPAGPLGKFVVK